MTEGKEKLRHRFCCSVHKIDICDCYGYKINDLESKLKIAREALEELRELPDVDKDQTFVIARDALKEIGEGK